LNQKLIAGLGNIYADEACFLAGVRPQRRVNKLTLLKRKKFGRQRKKFCWPGLKIAAQPFLIMLMLVVTRGDTIVF
jgi:predicted ribosome quality control (RQC) complex YloA/Tae2 family protein